MDLKIFRQLLSRDPDGWEQEKPPTKDDYDNFRLWVIHHYGEAVYDSYMNHPIWEGSDR